MYVAYLKCPGSVRGERVSCMDDVTVSSKTAQQIPHALGQRAYHRMDQNFGHQILRCELDESFPYKKTRQTIYLLAG